MGEVTNFFADDGNKYAIQLAKSIQMMSKLLNQSEQYFQIEAQLKKAKFDALIDAGFTKEQALELCKN